MTTHRASSSSSSSTVRLLLSPTPTSPTSSTTAVGVGGGKLVCFHLGEGWEEGGVDLGAIGRALGLDPASVRLNGYLLGARGPDHVAASVTWGSLLAFFSARGLPTGTGRCAGPGGLVAADPAADDPVIVQGRPNPPATPCGDRKISGFCLHYDGINRCHQEGRRSANPKRKLASGDESPPGKGELGRCNSPVLEDRVGDSLLCIKKKLRLDDESPLEKRKNTERDSGQTKLPTCTPPAGFPLNCVMGHRKRYREDELVAALPRKRTA